MSNSRWAAGVALAAVASGLPGAIRDSFWQDEIASARVIVEPSFGTMLGHVRGVETTPPAWYAGGWFLHELGLSPYGYRLFGLVFAAALAAGTFLLARRFLALSGSLVATAFVIFGYQFVFHARELRAYELYAALAVLFALTLLRLEERPSTRRLVALGLVVALGSLTNYFFLLFLASGLAWLWLGRRATRRRATAAIAVGLAPFYAWIPSMLAQYHHGRFSWIGPFDARRAASAYWLLVARSEPRTAVLHSLAPYLAAAVVLVAAAWLARRTSGELLVALLAVAPVLTAAVVWAAGPEVFDTQNVLGAGPFAAIVVVALASRLRLSAALPLGLAALGLLVFGYVSNEVPTTTNYQGIARDLVQEGWAPRDPILLYSGNFFSFRGPLEWYLPGRPDLSLGKTTARACPRAFVVVAGKGRTRALSRRLRWSRALQTTRVTIAPLPRRGWFNAVRLAPVHVMTAVVGHAACVRPLTEAQLRGS